jgi:cobalamin biosynthesis protein CbiG
MKHHCQVKKTKHPWPGQTLPVVVDRNNKERIDIQWEEVQTVDEQMAAGTPTQVPGVEVMEGQTIDLTGTPMGDQIMQALQQQGLVPEQPGAGASDAAGGGDDRLAQLERLAKLRDSGALTETEFQTEKARLLSGL